MNARLSRNISKLVSIGCLISVCLFSGSVASQSDKAVTRAPSEAVASEVGIGDLYLVAIGVSKYKNPKINLNFADKDARAVASFFKKQTNLFRKVHIEVLTNEKATKSEVEKHLFYKLRRAGKNDTIIVFLSGHGADDPNTPGEFFFLTHDADDDFLAATAVHMNHSWFLNKLESKRIVLIADACYAGRFSIAAKSLRSRFHEKLADMYRESEGTIIIASSRPDQLSREEAKYGQSLFTHHLLEGLGGKADQNRDGVVTLNEAYAYVYLKTHSESRGNQSPRTEGHVVGMLPLALVKNRPTLTENPRKPIPPNASQEQPLSEIEKLVKRAEAGDSEAQNELGEKYAYGHGVEKDPKEAVKWYRKAAEQGYAFSQYNLGYMYQHGHGIPKDAKMAVKWYTKAGKQGVERAQISLGNIYQNGLGVSQDLEKAKEWFLMAANQGNELAISQVTKIQVAMADKKRKEEEHRAAKPKPTQTQNNQVTRNTSQTQRYYQPQTQRQNVRRYQEYNPVKTILWRYTHFFAPWAR